MSTQSQLSPRLLWPLSLVLCSLQGTALQCVSPERQESVVFLYHLWQPIQGSAKSVRTSDQLHLRGLDPATRYRVQGGEGGAYTGEELMRQGLHWNLRGPQKSAVVRLRADWLSLPQHLRYQPGW